MSAHMSIPPQGGRGVPLRYRRRKPVLDLNEVPSETRDQEGTSDQAAMNNVQVAQVAQRVRFAPTIDIVDLEDDVIESSPRAFAEAKNNARRTRARTIPLLDVESGVTTGVTVPVAPSVRYKRRRVPVNCDVINLESSGGSTPPVEPSPPPPPPPPPPPEPPIFNCPICMAPFVEETSTKCGHIFCKKCIKDALAFRAKCPTCRKKVTARDLIRVFLPSTG
ncbi:E3 ubiquitin-protein ligase RNF4 [Linum grandiflorum]